MQLKPEDTRDAQNTQDTRPTPNSASRMTSGTPPYTTSRPAPRRDMPPEADDRNYPSRTPHREHQNPPRHTSSTAPDGNRTPRDARKAPPPSTPSKAPLCARRAQTFALVSTVLTMLVLTVWGLCFFLRPTVSETEKRELTAFPSFTWESFLSGEWSAQVGLWYSDTFPGRDGLVSAWHGVQSLYGLRGERFQGGQGDQVPDETMGDPSGYESNPPDKPVVGEPTGERVNGYYLRGDTAYELYYFDRTAATRYAALLNRAADALAGKAKVYDMVIPLAYTFALDENLQKSLGVADGVKAANYLYSGMKDTVTTVNAAEALAAHKDQYIYFRTDHHWTATGAYYAYTAFCKEAGLTPTPLSSYEKLSFQGFLGTLYAKTGEPSALSGAPDVVEAYVPRGTNAMTILDRSGKQHTEYPIVQKRTDDFYRAAASKYNCFIAGDNPLTTIHNTNIASDRKGTSVLLIKESFGNAFAPFLVDSFEYVYIIDYRYYEGTLVDFVTSHQVQHVLFLNNLVATTAGARLSEMEKLLPAS